MMTRYMIRHDADLNYTQVGINTSFLDLGFNNLRKVPNLALRKLVLFITIIMIIVMLAMLMRNWGREKRHRLLWFPSDFVDNSDSVRKQMFDGILNGILMKAVVLYKMMMTFQNDDDDTKYKM